jgi:hypothetical protein
MYTLTDFINCFKAERRGRNKDTKGMKEKKKEVKV